MKKLRIILRETIADSEGKAVEHRFTIVVVELPEIFKEHQTRSYPLNMPEIIGGEWLDEAKG